MNIGTSAYNWAGDSWTFQRRWSGVWGLGGYEVAVCRGSGVQGLRGFGIGLKGLVGYGVQRFRGIGFKGSGVYRV